MAARHEDEHVSVGEDSFLDTIANLVGIIIILVVIVGTRGYSSARAEARQELETRRQQLAAPLNKTENLDRDIEQQAAQMEKYELELAYRNSERMTMVDRVTLAENIIDERLKQLDETQVADVETNQALSELQKQLQDLLQQSGDGDAADKTIVLQHLPTPMAKTVFGKELHVMLKNKLVTVIPWDELIEGLKEQVRRTADRGASRNQYADVLGPMDGFLMHYKLLSKSGLMSDGRRAAMGRMIELDKFELEPTNDVMKESVDQSLGPNGRLRVELNAGKSKQITITVWVYPESFGEFRKLMEKLFTAGFLCAARPLPEGMRIGASPRGSSSVAQ